jgi:hypothetical protein
VVPFVTSIATVSTTSFLLFTTSAVSIRILTAVVGGAVAAGVSGETIRRYANSWVADGYRDQIRQEIWNKSVGDPDNLEAESVCRRLLTEIDMIALKRLDKLQ